jgi:hypothetical protein
LVYFQFQNNPIALLEWFAASVAIVVVVTLIYVFVLNRSQPPEGTVVSKTENQPLPQATNPVVEPSELLTKANTALKENRLGEAVEISAGVVSVCLTLFIQRIETVESQESRRQLTAMGLGMSDLAYLIQKRAKSSPQFAEMVYQLNMLRLRALQNQMHDQQQANWAVSFATWFDQIVRTDQIKF